MTSDGEERRVPNQWNVFQAKNQGLKKKDCKNIYMKEKETNPIKPEKKKGNKTRIRCSLDKFRKVLDTLNDKQRDVILTTPFASLLDFQQGSLSLQKDLIKSIVRHINCGDQTMTLTVHKGSETQDVPIKVEDFSRIMGIPDGDATEGAMENEVNDEDEVDYDDLLSKYCLLEQNGKYKYIDIKRVEETLNGAAEDNAIKQSFALIALHYIVCPAPAGKLGKKYLGYVKNVNSLHTQSWATIAMDGLKDSIQTFVKGKGVERNLGGCTLFLQLYCMETRGYKEGLKVSEIDEGAIKKFHRNWMIDHASEKKRKNFLAEKICKDMKYLSDRIKVEPETVELRLLLEIDALNEKCKNTIAVSRGLIGSDQAASSRTYSYPNSEDREHVEISDGDIERLQPGRWMSTKLIDFYLLYLKLNRSDLENYHFFTTTFYPKLKEVLSAEGIAEKPFDKFRKWWSKVDILQKEYIVIPIIGDSHWSVVIVCMRNNIDKSEPVLLHLDSYSSQNSNQVFKNIKWFLEKEELNRDRVKSNVLEVECQVPQQQNAFDCGLYALLFIEHFIKHAPNKMETEYETMFGEKWFHDNEVEGLRSRMKSILSSFRQGQNLEDNKRKRCGEESDDVKSNDDHVTIVAPQLKVKAARKTELCRLGVDVDVNKRVLRTRK